jgi:hypothetical protein
VFKRGVIKLLKVAAASFTDMSLLNELDEDVVIRFPIRPHTFKRGKVRLMSADAFEKALDPGRLSILKLIAFGVSRPPVIRQKLKLPKSTLYKHISVLAKYGWIERGEFGLVFSAPVYLVYEVEDGGPGSLSIRLVNGKGAFVDEKTGFIIINGVRPIPNCIKCPMLRQCTQHVKLLANTFNVTLRSGTPAEAYIEVLTWVTSKNLAKILNSIYLDLSLR